jgi:histidine ammonia-lyase
MSKIFLYGIDNLTVSAATGLATNKIKGVLNDAAITKIKASQQHVQQIVKNDTTMYGINTGWHFVQHKNLSRRYTNAAT